LNYTRDGLQFTRREGAIAVAATSDVLPCRNGGQALGAGALVIRCSTKFGGRRLRTRRTHGRRSSAIVRPVSLTTWRRYLGAPRVDHRVDHFQTALGDRGQPETGSDALAAGAAIAVMLAAPALAAGLLDGKPFAGETGEVGKRPTGRTPLPSPTDSFIH